MKKLLLSLLFALGLTLFVSSQLKAPVRFQHPNAPQNMSATVDAPDPCHHAVVCGGVHASPGATYKRSILPYNIWGFVTYRKNGKIHTTREERMIPKGTTVWEDSYGNIMLEKCGNMVLRDPDVSLAPTTEPSDIFPPIEVPVSGIVPNVEIPPTVPAPPTTPTTPVPPGTPPTYPQPPCCGGIVPPITPPIHVSEPSTIIFTMWGIGILLIAGRIYSMGRKKMEERREFPRGAGTIKKIEDITYETLREHNLAEPTSRCSDCGAPIEDGHKCEHC